MSSAFLSSEELAKTGAETGWEFFSVSPSFCSVKRSFFGKSAEFSSGSAGAVSAFGAEFSCSEVEVWGVSAGAVSAFSAGVCSGTASAFCGVSFSSGCGSGGRTKGGSSGSKTMPFSGCFSSGAASFWGRTGAVANFTGAGAGYFLMISCAESSKNKRPF